MGKPSNYYLLKLNRVVAWILLFLFAVFAISGYGITNPNLVKALTGGIITKINAIRLHRILDMPLFVLVVSHVLIELKFTLQRWGVRKGRLLNALLLIMGGFSIGLLTLMDTVRY